MYEKDQFKRPVGEEGRRVIEHMNDHHRGVTEWGLSVLPDIRPKKILDIGCGGGMCLSLLGKKYPSAKLNGIDISDESVKAATSYNQELVDSGRLEVMYGDVSDPPFKKERFDLITAVETYFFWPDLKTNIENVSEILSPGGMFLIISEVRFTDSNHNDIEKMNTEYGSKVVSDEVVLDHLRNAGMKAELFTHPERTWAAYLGKK